MEIEQSKREIYCNNCRKTFTNILPGFSAWLGAICPKCLSTIPEEQTKVIPIPLSIPLDNSPNIKEDLEHWRNLVRLTKPVLPKPRIDLLDKEQILDAVMDMCSREKIQLAVYNLDNFKYEEGKIENEACAICCIKYKNEEEISKISCGHQFHSWCLGTWLLQKSTCPVCRFKI